MTIIELPGDTEPSGSAEKGGNPESIRSCVQRQRGGQRFLGTTGLFTEDQPELSQQEPERSGSDGRVTGRTGVRPAKGDGIQEDRNEGGAGP